MEVGNAFFRAGLARCAFVVLSGAVITSFVRTGDLVGSLAVDRCLPRTSCTGTLSQGTDSVFLVCLFALCVSQVVMLDCNIEALDGVYCFKFLSVMTTFLFGNRALKVKRPSLPRTHRISWTKSVLGFCAMAMALALLGDVIGKLDLLLFFMIFGFELFKRAAIIRQLFPSSGLMSG